MEAELKTLKRQAAKCSVFYVMAFVLYSIYLLFRAVILEVLMAAI